MPKTSTDAKTRDRPETSGAEDFDYPAAAGTALMNLFRRALGDVLRQRRA